MNYEKIFARYSKGVAIANDIVLIVLKQYLHSKLCEMRTIHSKLYGYNIRLLTAGFEENPFSEDTTPL